MKQLRLTVLALFVMPGVAAVTGHTDEPAVRGIRAVAFAPDGKSLAVVTGEPQETGTATLWDVAGRTQRWTHTEPTGIPAVAFAPDGKTLAIGAYNGTAKILDLPSGRETAVLRHPKEVRAVAFAPDGKSLATACWDHTVRIWDLAAGTERIKCTGHTDRIFTVAFSPDATLLLSAGGSDGAKLWDAATGQEKRTWKHGSFFVPCAEFSPDGRWALTGGYDGTARLWNAGTGELRAKFKGFGGVNRAAISPTAHALAAAGTGGYVTVFDLNLSEPSGKDQDRIRTLVAKWDDPSYDVREAASKELLQVGFVAENELRRLMKDAPSAEVRIRARRVRQDMLTHPRWQSPGDSEQIEGLAFSPDGTLLAAAGKDGIVRLFDVRTGKESARLTP